ncbi:putative salivary secreted peptide [Podospora didyma]|uniref:Salivary secreted peptide n=1 Tax=Podospora didyma TaxID=330526 RepID=A0AAE0K1I6_9PEZI|nr:putative salivary secreted peptide [Podospora didyma]
MFPSPSLALNKHYALKPQCQSIMKSFGAFLFSLSLLGVSFVQATNSTTKCNSNNCARAVTGTRQGPAFTSKAKEDCSSFVVTTKYGHTVTVTAPAAPSVDRIIPTYASACSGSAAYASACSCYGIPSQIVSNAEGTTTVTVTGASNSVSSTAPPVPSQTGPGYQPSTPSSYAGCDLDPAKGGEFELLDPNALAIINKNGKAVEATDPDAAVTQFVFSHPPAAPVNVYDIIIPGNSPLYLAIFKSGAVGFVDASSNGQAYVPHPSGDDYVTSVWSLQCDGLTTAGILGGAEFQFSVKDSGDIVVITSPPALRKLRKARDIPVPKGFLIKPKAVVTPPGSKCPSPVQHAVTKTPPRPVTSNGCGPEDWRQYFVPNLEFEDSCNAHDVCWSQCDASMGACNAAFLNGMLATCNARHAAGSKVLAACRNLAEYYHSKVSGPSGAAVFTKSMQDFCDCKCDDTTLTACGDKCVNTKTDAENCGQCNFHCPSGSCTNGACSFNSCTGKTCDTFGPCGPGGDCVCASITGGNGFCVNGNTPCAGLADCGDSSGCPLGSVCAVGTCCGRNVCITTDSCGGYNTPSRLFMARDWVNATIGHPAVYGV